MHYIRYYRSTDLLQHQGAVLEGFYEMAEALRALVSLANRPAIAALLSKPCAPTNRIIAGAQQCAAHGLYRPTHERPDAGSPPADPTQRWCSDCGKDGANVTGKSAPSVELHPSLALGLDCTEAATSRRRRLPCHPAVAMGAQ